MNPRAPNSATEGFHSELFRKFLSIVELNYSLEPEDSADENE